MLGLQVLPAPHPAPWGEGLLLNTTSSFTAASVFSRQTKLEVVVKHHRIKGRRLNRCCRTLPGTITMLGVVVAPPLPRSRQGEPKQQGQTRAVVQPPCWWGPLAKLNVISSSQRYLHAQRSVSGLSWLSNKHQPAAPLVAVRPDPSGGRAPPNRSADPKPEAPVPSPNLHDAG